MTPDQITGIIRAILAAIGGFFVGKGIISSDFVNWASGGILTLAPIVWSLWTNRPAGLASSTQALPGVNVTTSAAAPQAVKDAVSDAKK